MPTVFQVSAELGAEFTGEAAFDEAVAAAEALQADVAAAEKQVASLGDAMVAAKRAAEDAAEALRALKAAGGASAEALADATKRAETTKANLTALKRASEDAATGLQRAKTAAADGTARLRDLEAQAGATAARTKDAATRAGDFDTALKGVAGAVGVVSPQLETLLMRSGDVVGGFEALWKGSEALGVSLGGVGLAIGAVAVAAAAGATAYSLYAVEQERAADAGGRTAERLAEVTRVGDLATATLNRLATSGSAFTNILDGISDRSRVAAGELQSVIDAEKAVASLRAAAAPELQARGQQAASLAAQLQAAQSRMAQGVEGEGGIMGAAKASADVKRLSAELAASEAALRAQRAEVERAAETEALLREKAQIEADLREKEAEALRRGAEATRRKAEADRAAAQEAAKRQAADEAAYAAAVALTDAQRKLALDAYNTVSAIEALNPALTDAERAYRAQTKQIDDLAASLGQAALAGDVLPEEFARLIDLISAAREQALADLETAKAEAEKSIAETQTAQAAPPQDRAGDATQVIGGIVGGSLSAALQPLLASLGPQGAIAGAVLSLLEQGPEQITAIIDALPSLVGGVIDTVLSLVETLPETLIGLVDGIVAKIPDLLLAVFSLVYGPFAFEIINGLLQALPEIISGLIVGLTELAFMLPSILLDTAKLVPVIVQSLTQIAPMLREQMIAAIPALIDDGREMLTTLARDFRREIIADAAALLTREGRRNRRNEEGLVKRLRGALTVDLDGRQVSRGLDRTADSRKGGERRG